MLPNRYHGVRALIIAGYDQAIGDERIADERPRLHLRHHAAGRRAIARLQHDRCGEDSAWPPSWWNWAWTFSKPGFPIASRGRFRSGGRGQPRIPLGEGGGAGPLLHAATSSAPPRSLKHARRPRIHTFIATSDIHLKYKLKKSRQQVLDEAVAAVELARAATCDDVEFSAEDATRTDPDYLEKISNAVVAAGARTVNLPDTVGYSAPRGVWRADRPHREGAGRLRHRQRALP